MKCIKSLYTIGNIANATNMRFLVNNLLDAESGRVILYPARQFATTGTCNDIWDTTHMHKPKAIYGAYRRKVHYPKEYTVKPLDNTNLAGRDPNTGRVIVATWGGGIKHKFHWIDWVRRGPTDDSPPVLEKVLKIMKCGCRTPFIALVGVNDRLKYIIATVNMKAGDVLKTSQYIPRNPVLANEGDAYPLGALSVGLEVNCIEKYPGLGAFFVHAAGSHGTILRKVNDRVIVRLPSKLEVSLPQTCMATVGVVSNVEHKDEELGSANALRESGRRPRSGLFQKKTGRFGRKIKPPPPVKYIDLESREKEPQYFQFTYPPFNMTYRPANLRYHNPKPDLKTMYGEEPPLSVE